MPAIILPTNPVKKIFFVHIPKCGGMSVLAFFRELGAQIYLEWENNKILPLMRCPTGHMHYDQIDQVVRLDKFHLSFAIVRNPYERALSDYHWANRNRHENEWPKFDAWLNWVIVNYQRDPFFLDNHIRPQNQFIGSKVGYIFKYEEGLSQAMQSVLRRVQINLSMDVIKSRFPHKNRRESSTKRSKYLFDANPDTIKTFRKLYEEDFRNFYPNS